MTREEQKWALEIFEKINGKINVEADRIGEKIPYIPDASGKYQDTNNIGWWTNGFYGGMLWQLYNATGNQKYRAAAERLEERLDEVIEDYEGLDHDTGFMWMHTAVANYRLTGNEDSRRRGMHVANILAGRFNPLGNFIRAWNGDKTGWMIIDCLMNLSLLYWATDESKDPRFRAIAELHAATALDKLVRPDGSCGHIAVLDPMTGELLELPGGQGFESGSSWSRGQAWAVYGLAISYAHTKDGKYLDAAKKVAHYFISNLAVNDWLPLCDFRSPENPVLYDATAGAIAACGFLEIARHVPEHEKRLYEKAAFNCVKAMVEKFADFDPENDGLLGYGKVAYHDGGKWAQEKIIYGDYFLTEAILRMLEKGFFIW